MVAGLGIGPLTSRDVFPTARYVRHFDLAASELSASWATRVDTEQGLVFWSRCWSRLRADGIGQVLGINVSPHMVPEDPPHNLEIQIDDLNGRSATSSQAKVDKVLSGASQIHLFAGPV